MTADTRRLEYAKSHAYLLDGEKVPGVTTIIGNGLPKPALINWAGNVTAEYAVDHWDDLAQCKPSERLNTLKKARYADRDKAANRGTQVHALAEQLVRGEQVDVPEELAGHVDSYVRFLDEWDVEPLVVERPVFNRRWKYGGTLDLIAKLGDGTTRLLDVKTNRSGPFGDTAFQLAGYRGAEFWLDEAGAEQPMPAIDSCAVVWVRADGYDLIPFGVTEQTFKQFLYIAQVAKAAEACRDLRGEALTPPILRQETAA